MKISDLKARFCARWPTCKALAAQLGADGKAYQEKPCQELIFSYARGLAEVLLFTLSFALGIVVPASIVSWDVAHLRGPQLERAWPDAGLWSAVVVFGPLCVPVHYIRTRRSWLGLALGVFWLLCTVVVTVAPVEAWGRIFHVSE